MVQLDSDNVNSAQNVVLISDNKQKSDSSVTGKMSKDNMVPCIKDAATDKCAEGQGNGMLCSLLLLSSVARSFTSQSHLTG